ncbi:hypothetical protein K439DRAFT_1624653 [Ramaria rubella]|nr:hypothetical protein K439DRAFT_1624653 [Ramaria rubella]
MIRQSCKVKFQIYEPYDLTACPFILIVVSGIHTHTPPLPLSTPIQVEAAVLDLLRRMGHELADAHPAVLSRLRELLLITNPTPIDLHLSLANKDHILIYIRKAKDEIYPAGTDWEDQDLDKIRKERYIRVVKEFPSHDKDDGPFRVILCMTAAMSRRLISAKWIQSDIGFKRASGNLEFELVGWDRDKDRSDVYARAFLNHQTAEAHRILFHLIDSIVLEDTGQKLQWRHIHSVTLNAPVGIAQWAGIGLYPQDRAAEFPLNLDIHQPERHLISLTPYEHLRRCFRLCHVHFKRKIKQCKASEMVKNLMRSLVCVTHPDFDGTVAAICQQGGKAGYDWVQDKVRNSFAFAGICWQKSFIPKEVWLAAESNTNVLEMAHADVNREGWLYATGSSRIRRERGKTLVQPGFCVTKISYQPQENFDVSLVASQSAKVDACHNDVVQAEQEYEDSLNGRPAVKRRKGVCAKICNLETLHQSKEKLVKAQKALQKVEISATQFIGQGSGKVIPLTQTVTCIPLAAINGC